MPGTRLLAFLLLLTVCAPLSAQTPSSYRNATVRLALVNVPDALLKPMLPEFEKQTGIKAEIVYTGNDPYSVARQGKADLVISHYGHEGVKPFVTGGFGLWPHPVFANQMVLLGPPSDPARVHGLTDAAEAFRRIAASQSTFVVNNEPAIKYLESTLWISAGVQQKGKWYQDFHSRGGRAIRDAAKNKAYVLWGLPPFLRMKQRRSVDLVPMVTADPILQRTMVSVIVNPEKVQGVNAKGAKAFQDFLLAPATQARIRAFRYPEFDGQAWWPAGRDNDFH